MDGDWAKSTPQGAVLAQVAVHDNEGGHIRVPHGWGTQNCVVRLIWPVPLSPRMPCCALTKTNGSIMSRVCRISKVFRASSKKLSGQLIASHTTQRLAVSG